MMNINYIDLLIEKSEVGSVKCEDEARYWATENPQPELTPTPFLHKDFVIARHFN